MGTITIRFFDRVIPCLLALIFLATVAGNAVAQGTITSPPTINGTNALNQNFPTGNPNGTSTTAVLTGLGLNQGVTFDVTATLSGTGVWNSGLAFETTTRLRAQARLTNNTTNSASYDFTFSDDVWGLQFTMDGLDNGDETTMTFYRDGAVIPADASWFVSSGGIIQTFDDGATLRANGNGNVSGPPPFGAGEQFRIELPPNVAVDRVVFAPTHKNNGNNGNVTVYWYDFAWSVPSITISKVSNGDTGSFSFTGNNGLGTQTIATTTQGTAVNTAPIVYNDASVATTIQETIPPGWALTNVGCVGLGAGGSFTPNLATGEVVLDAAAITGASDITCTFTNATATDLQVVKSVDNPNAAVGQTRTFTITATNNGPNAATNVSIVDPIPVGFNYTSHTASGSTTYNQTSGVWNIGNLANGATATLTLEVVADASAANTTVTNTVTGVILDQVDANDTPDTLTASVAISNPLTILAQDDEYTVGVDGNLGESAFINVLQDNGSGTDTVNGGAANSTQVIASPVGAMPFGVSLTSDGDVTVAPGTSEGIKTFDYQICEVGFPTNCATASVVFTVINYSGTGLPPNPQVCTAATPTFNLGSGTVTAGSRTANFSYSVNSAVGFAGVSPADGNSLLLTFAPDAGSNPDELTVTFGLSGAAGSDAVIRLHGGREVPSVGPGDNAAAEYTVSWTGGTGNATYYDPATPNAGMYRFPPAATSNFDLNQRQVFGLETSGGVANGGTFRVFDVLNAENDWYLEFPRGATSVTIRRDVLSFGTATQGVDYALPQTGNNGNAGESFQEWLTLDALLCESADYSDAPSSYGGASHQIISGIQLGATITAETADYNDPAAAGDVDDGATVPALTQGATAVIPVQVTGTGVLQAWIDFDLSGTFDTGEEVAINASDGGAGDNDGTVDGVITLQASVPVSAVAGTSFARFRFSSTTGLGPTGSANDGEVEDYQVSIAPASPNLTIVKTASAPGFTTGNIADAPAGTVITYTYVVTNTGNITVDNISIADVHDGVAGDPLPANESLTTDNGIANDSTDATNNDGTWDTLAPGDEVTFTATYTVQQGDIDTLQ